MEKQTSAVSEVRVNPSLTLEKPYARAPPPPPHQGGGVGLRQTLQSSSAGGTPDNDVAKECRTRETMAQQNNRQETAVTEEEELENTEDNIPESKPNADARLSSVPTVDFSGIVK